MKLPILILSLVLPYCAYAQEISGIGSSPMQPQRLTDELSFSVISQPPANTLHWKITRDKKISEKGADSSTSGEAVLPGEKYTYFWDQENKIFWFSTVRALLRMDISDWASTKSVTRSTKGFESYEDLPSVFRDNVRKILE